MDGGKMCILTEKWPKYLGNNETQGQGINVLITNRKWHTL